MNLLCRKGREKHPPYSLTQVPNTCLPSKVLRKPIISKEAPHFLAPTLHHTVPGAGMAPAEALTDSTGGKSQVLELGAWYNPSSDTMKRLCASVSTCVTRDGDIGSFVLVGYIPCKALPGSSHKKLLFF